MEVKTQIQKKYSFTRSGGYITYGMPENITIRDKDNNIITTFSWHGATSGCGLAIIGNIINFSYNVTDDKLAVIKEALIEFFTQENTTTNRKGCILATLGNSYYANYEKSLLKLDFVFLHEFDNLA